MRVLLLNQVFHPDPQATSQYLSRLAEELVERGHQVTVLTGRRDYDDPSKLHANKETWRGVEIIRVWNTGFGHGARWCYAIDFLSFLVLASLRGLFLRRAEVVVTLTTPPLISVLGACLSWLWRARFVYWVMDLNPDEAVAIGWLNPASRVARFLEAVSRWTLQHAHRVIVLDRYMRDRLISKGIKEEKIAVIPLWEQGDAAFDTGTREQFRRKHGMENKYVVMYAGNHTPCHPLATLVEAARLLRDDPKLLFCFAGFGTEWGKLRERAQTESWRNTLFLGFQPLTTGILSGSDMQVVVMGDPLVGIIHPCKIYNILAAQRPLIYIGPERSHITDIIEDAGLKAMTISLRHGESESMANQLRQKSQTSESERWPAAKKAFPWMEHSALENLISNLTGST